MKHSIQIRKMKSEDIEGVYDIFTEHSINKPKEYVQLCWEENEK